MAHFDKDVRCREIYTQAVCGKGSKYSQTTYTIRPANRPSTIGGCWVMNHTCNAEMVGDYAEVHGRFDVNVWYSYNGNTETGVAKDTVSYVQQIPLRELDPYASRDGMQVAVKVLQQPNCLDATIVDGGNEILVRVEQELAVEVMGKTKLYVLVSDQPSEKDDDEPLEDELEDDIFAMNEEDDEEFDV